MELNELISIQSEFNRLVLSFFESKQVPALLAVALLPAAAAKLQEQALTDLCYTPPGDKKTGAAEDLMADFQKFYGQQPQEGTDGDTA